MRRLRGALLWAALGLCLAAPMGARELHWSRFDVSARLDADGRLHVVERQAIVFTGDWNGGYRSFRVSIGQKLAFEGLSRIDPSTGAAHPLSSGDLSAVDQFKWTDSSTIRWRSRLPSDPDFDNTEIVYELRFTYSNILVHSGETYRLRHDFAFPDREAPIEKFALNLELDPAWSAPAGFSGHVERKNLLPGEGVVVDLALRHVGSGNPAGVVTVVPPSVRRGIAVGAVLAAVWLYVLYRRREEALGRFDPIVPVSEINEEWLEKNVFDLRPEEAGAVWDDKIGGAEVGALLARLVAEKKLASRVETKGWGPFRSQVLHLELKTNRDRLEGYENSLIAGLFFDSRIETDTKAIREHYSGTGFDPASKIRSGVEAALTSQQGLGGKSPAPSHRPTLLLLAAGLFLLLLSCLVRPATFAFLFTLGFICAFCLGPALLLAYAARRDILGPNVRLFVGVLLALLPSVVMIFWFVYPGLPVTFFAGAGILSIAIVNAVFNFAKTRESAARVKKRRILAAGREYFQRELTRPSPRLKDEWFPYAIGFGLGDNVDRWFGRFGAATSASTSAVAASSWSSGGSSSGGGWTGGGGAFGGAGATAGWVSAVGVISAGVATPSSSGGGGGGGGGGGSSGGGGGGGW